MKFKIYPKYKDSGIKWIEKIPDDWKVRKIKYFSKLFTGSTPESGNDAYWNGEIIWVTPLDLNNSGKFVSSSKRKITKEGFLRCGTSFINKGAIILATRAPIGYPKITNAKLCFNQGCKAFEIEKECIADYCYYYFVAFEDILKSKGNATTFSELSTYDLASFLVLKPSIKEQNIIAYHLDKKTVEIDELIEKDKKLIELLKEKRIALINHAVTKGLDPNVKMKDSGIKWIGEIPEDWKTLKLKFLGDSIIGLTYSPNDIIEEGSNSNLILRSSNIQNNKLTLHDNIYVNKRIPKKLITKKGDILICSRNGSRDLIGKNICIDESIMGCSFGAFMTVYRTKYWRFMSLFFNSQVFKSQSGLFITATINQLTIGTLNNFYVAIPSNIEEQLAIASFLDKVTTKIDKTIQKIEEKIKLLEEYKKSLIHHAVTGKIDVREVI